MVVFPNCKINIGLSITGKRSDGYHNLESVIMPINWTEALEITARTEKSSFESVIMSEATSGNANFYGYGNAIPGEVKNNLCLRVFGLLTEWFNLPATDIHLLKSLPIGAGLGGGSADAAFCLRAIKDFYNLSISDAEAKQLLARIGSDCPFFWDNKPAYVFGTGTEMRNVELDLSDYWLLVIYPNIIVSTVEAYSGVVPKPPQIDLSLIDSLPVESWRGSVINDFEESIFPVYPLLKTLKEELYDNGAKYASMSGSGSAMYGIFSEEPAIPSRWLSYQTWSGKLG